MPILVHSSVKSNTCPDLCRRHHTRDTELLRPPTFMAPPGPQRCSPARTRLLSASHNLGGRAPSPGAMPPNRPTPSAPAAGRLAEWKAASRPSGHPAKDTCMAARPGRWWPGRDRRSHPGVRASRCALRSGPAGPEGSSVRAPAPAQRGSRPQLPACGGSERLGGPGRPRVCCVHLPTLRPALGRVRSRLLLRVARRSPASSAEPGQFLIYSYTGPSLGVRRASVFSVNSCVFCSQSKASVSRKSNLPVFSLTGHAFGAVSKKCRLIPYHDHFLPEVLCFTSRSRIILSSFLYGCDI